MGNKLDSLQLPTYPAEIQQLFLKICEAFKKGSLEQNLSLRRLLSYKPRADEKSVCAKIITKGDAVVHCQNCQVDKSCIICLACFENGNHEGHRYQIFKGASGCCDCGDKEAWSVQGFCARHSGEVKEVEISKEKLDKFVMTWGYLFYWYFALELRQFGDVLLTCLTDITKSMEYNQLLTACLSTRFSPELHPKLKADCYAHTILETIFLQALPAHREPFCQLFISMFPNYNFKKQLVVSYFECYESLLSLKEARKDFSSLSWQLLTSHDLVLYALCRTNKVLRCPVKPIALLGEPNAFSHLETYISDTMCLCKLTNGVNLEYVRRFLSDIKNLESLAVYMNKVEEDWKDTFEDSEITDVFHIELIVIDVVFLIARVAMADRRLLFSTILGLAKHLQAQPALRNSCFLPMHRFLVIFLSAYMEFCPEYAPTSEPDVG